MPYSTLSSPPLSDQHFPKFLRGQDKGDFLFSKILQLFIIFFIMKRVTGGLFDYYGIVFKEEKNIVHSQFEGIIFI